ncbi:hypothetical protein HDU67_006319 [Dinochytrium kinnereticum]|nr:hypothetical protein HDU67_006319 [Dinochytrium kinnereticum]
MGVLAKLLDALDSRIGAISVLSLVALDGILCQAQLTASLYDPAFSTAIATSSILAASALGVAGGSNQRDWQILRNFFFWFSFSIRGLFLLEVVIRIFGRVTPALYFKDPLHIVDLIIIVASLILKPSLPVRESLVANPLILVRLWRLGAMIRNDKELELNEYRRMVEEERKMHEVALENQRRIAEAKQKQIDAAHDKLKLLLGEETFQSEVAYPIQGLHPRSMEAAQLPDSASNYLFTSIKV